MRPYGPNRTPCALQIQQSVHKAVLVSCPRRTSKLMRHSSFLVSIFDDIFPLEHHRSDIHDFGSELMLADAVLLTRLHRENSGV